MAGAWQGLPPPSLWGILSIQQGTGGRSCPVWCLPKHKKQLNSLGEGSETLISEPDKAH